MIVMREKDRHWADEREAPGSVGDGTVVVHATNTLHAKAIVHCIAIHSTLYHTLWHNDAYQGLLESHVIRSKYINERMYELCNAIFVGVFCLKYNFE